jgi:hypothetical protein
MVKGLIFDLIIGKETTHMPTVSAVAASRIVHEVLLRRPDITYIYKRPNKKMLAVSLESLL